MKITKSKENSALTLALNGRLDTNTAPELETELKASLNGIETLVIDMEELAYLSSAGLRVILAAQKQMNKQGRMIILKVNDMVMEVFEVTGFTDILTIE